MSDKRTYSIGFDITRERLTLTVNKPEGEIPFNVWRDLARLSGVSIGTPECVVYEFRPDDTASLEKAERILQGALFQAEASLPSDYEACGDCGFDHEYEHAHAYKWHTNNLGKEK